MPESKSKHWLNWCKLFGHPRPDSGWWGGGLYGRVTGGKEDGIGRTHYQVRLKCGRCGEEYIAARFHGHQFAALTKASSP